MIGPELAEAKSKTTHSCVALIGVKLSPSVSRGRDAHYCAPPAQNRTCGIPAYGSHLGCLTRKR